MEFLEKTITLGIIAAIKNEYDTIFSQEDGTPLHFCVLVREFLGEEFPGFRIGRRGHNE